MAIDTREKVRLDEARLGRGLTLEALARESGLATRTVFRLMRGDRPHEATRRVVAQALKVKPGVLLFPADEDRTR